MGSTPPVELVILQKRANFSVKHRIQLARLPDPHAPGWATSRNTSRNFVT
jgi:hypothetical protein